jgi:molybdate transport system ATP-binding protein
LKAPFLSLSEATFRLGERFVFERTTWSVQRGEHWAVVGDNGSGKSLFADAICGRLPLVRGELRYHWEIKHQLGWVSPELHLHFTAAATCQEVVESGFHDTVGLFHSASARQRTLARRWLAQFGLLKSAHSPLYALSSGQQRMVLLARALVKAPRLLILDEPCQGLDATHRELFVRTVDALLCSQAVTAIYVTHRADEIPRSIQRVLRLSKGHAIVTGRLSARKDKRQNS